MPMSKKQKKLELLSKKQEKELQNMVNRMLDLAADVVKDYDDMDISDLNALSGSITQINQESPFLNEIFVGDSWKRVITNIQNLPKEDKRVYLDEFWSMIDPIVEGVAESLGFLAPDYLIRDYRFAITSAWFNQYLEGGEHNWHNHPGCQFTNCYYLELPDAEYKTDVIGADGKIVEYTVREGDVMTCPAWMKHRSKPNGPERKTIIAFNTNYEV